MNEPPVLATERRKNLRQLAIVKAFIRRVHPPALPIRLSVYTKNLNSYGAAFLVQDSISWQRNDELLSVFVVPVDNSHVVRTHYRRARVIWSQNGQIGIQFLYDAEGRARTH
jgi:hypothetical protein